MSKMSASNRNFMTVKVYEAIYKSHQGEQSIILESRTKEDRTSLIFTKIDGKEVRTSSLHELVVKQSDCLSLTIAHSVSIVWNDVLKSGVLYEIFMQKEDTSYVPIKLRLSIEGMDYDTSECDSFTEAISELHDLTREIAKWRLFTCYDCKYSSPAFLGPTSERDELQCYRDAPEAFKEVQEKGKFASNEVLHAGDYFVNIFHRCAAWTSL